MRITILTAGSRGDIQPYVALGMGLQAAGHDVQIATHALFQPFIEEHGLACYPTSGDPRASVAAETGQNWLEAGRNPLTFVRRLIEVARPVMRQIMHEYWMACQNADLLLYSVLATLAATTIGEKLDLPIAPAYLQSIHPTAHYPFLLAKPLGQQALRSPYNRLSYWSSEQIFWQVGRPIINQWRTQALNLPPYGLVSPFMRLLHKQPFCLYGYSSHVLPQPCDWPDNAHVTGYWFLNEGHGWQPPPKLADFLAAGPPPVYIGFGSMSTRNPAQLTAVALAALKLTGQRGLLLTGWGGITNADLPDHVFKIDAAPHDWLFPRMAAVVHHGGAGTTAAGLAAGVPSILTPFFADQPFWAWRVEQLGVGPTAIPQKQLTVERLAGAITQAVSDCAMQRRAAELGQRIRAEDGVGAAVAVVNGFCGDFSHAKRKNKSLK